MGFWLLLIPVLLAPLAFRRGLILILVLGLGGLTLAPRDAQAGTGAQVWGNLWQTPDQQAQTAFAGGDFQGAAQGFSQPDWKAASLYRGGDYGGAAGLMDDNAYNRGNALAKAGQLQEALDAYDKALAVTPDDADAKFNRDLVARLLDKQKQQEKQDQKSGDAQQQRQDQKPDEGKQEPQDQKAGDGQQQAEGQKPGDGQQRTEGQKPGEDQQPGEAQKPGDGQQAGQDQPGALGAALDKLLTGNGSPDDQTAADEPGTDKPTVR